MYCIDSALHILSAAFWLVFNSTELVCRVLFALVNVWLSVELICFSVFNAVADCVLWWRPLIIGDIVCDAVFN